MKVYRSLIPNPNFTVTEVSKSLSGRRRTNIHTSSTMVTKSKKEPKEDSSSDKSVFRVFDMGRWKVKLRSNKYKI